MALSGSSVATVGSYWAVVVEWSATQNRVANTSTITANLFWQGNGQYSAVSSSATKNWSITIAGETFSGTSSAALTAGQKRLIGTATKTIAHSNAGTASITITGQFNMAVTLSGVHYASKSTSGTYALDTIPRESSFGVIHSPVDAGSTVGIWISPADPSYTHDVTYYFGNYNHTESVPAGVTEHYFVIPIDWLDAIPNSTSGTGGIVVATKSGSTVLGTRSENFTVTVPSNVIPEIFHFSVSDLNASVVAAVTGEGVYLQDYSTLKFSLFGAGVYGSWAQSVKIEFDGKIGSTHDWEVVPSRSGTLTAVVTITDSRGRISEARTLDITIIPYTRPTINTFTTIRDGNVPTTVNTSFNVSFSLLTVGGTRKNTLTLVLQRKLRSATTWTDVQTTTITSTPYTVTNHPVTNTDDTMAYDFRLSLTDSLGNNVVAANVVPVAEVLLDLAKSGIGIGKRWESGTLDVKGEANFEDIQADDITTSGLQIEDIMRITSGVAEIRGAHQTIFEFYGNSASRTGYMGQLPYNSNTMYIRQEASSDLIIGTNTANLVVRGNSTNVELFNGNFNSFATLVAGNIFSQGQVVTSSINSKKNITVKNQMLNGNNALEAINSTPVYEYHLNEDNDNELKRTGLILEESPADIVYPNGDGIDIYSMVSVLWLGIQELTEMLEQKDTQINDLLQRVSQLEN